MTNLGAHLLSVLSMFKHHKTSDKHPRIRFESYITFAEISATQHVNSSDF
jgi:hypothetical protein